MYKLICMSFDGEYVMEYPEFETIEETWEYSNNLGSKWFFYPFHFVIKNQTIKSTPDLLNRFCNKRIKTVAKAFNLLSKKEEMQNANVEQFLVELHWGGNYADNNSRG